LKPAIGLAWLLSRFTVQVASFPLKPEAETLKSKLAGKGYDVFISESKQGDKGT